MKDAKMTCSRPKHLAAPLVLAGFLNTVAHAQMVMPAQGLQMPNMAMGAQGLLTGNMEADDMIRQMGVAAVCGMASNAAQGAQGAMSGVVQGAVSAFCGLQHPMAMMGQQPSMGVALAPIAMNGLGGGMGGMPGMGGMMPTGIPTGMNPNMLAGMVGGQLSPEQMIGQIAGQMVGQAVGNALGGAQGGNGNMMAGNIGAMATGGLMNGNMGMAAGGMMGGATGAPNIGQMVGAMVGTAVQQRIAGGNTGGANMVAGLPVVQGTAQPVMGYAYAPTTNLGAQANLMLSPQSGIRTGAPLVLQTYNVNGQTFVDTRPLNELVGGLRMASGAEPPSVGMRLGAFSGEVGGDIMQVSAGGMATQINPREAAYQEGFADGLNALDKDPILVKDPNYDAGYKAGKKQAEARNPVV